MKRGHIPKRMCAVCRKMQEKRHMLRLVCKEEGGMQPDPAGNAGGRGLYICRDAECLGQFLRGRKFKRRYWTGQNLPGMEYLEEQLKVIGGRRE